MIEVWYSLIFAFFCILHFLIFDIPDEPCHHDGQ